MLTPACFCSTGSTKYEALHPIPNNCHYTGTVTASNYVTAHRNVSRIHCHITGLPCSVLHMMVAYAQGQSPLPHNTSHIPDMIKAGHSTDGPQCYIFKTTAGLLLILSHKISLTSLFHKHTWRYCVCGKYIFNPG